MATLEEWEDILKELKTFPFGSWVWQNYCDALLEKIIFIVEDKISELKNAGKR